MRARRVLVVAGVGLVAYRIRQRGWRLVEHDLVDHPLMTLWPRLGDWLHDRDEPEAEDWRADLWARTEGQLLANVRRCVGCGCTDLAACTPPCSWAQLDPPVCSACEARSTVLPSRTVQRLGEDLAGQYSATTEQAAAVIARQAHVDPSLGTAMELVAQHLADTLEAAKAKVVEQGGDPDEWSFHLDDRAPLGVIRVLAVPPTFEKVVGGLCSLWPSGRDQLEGHYRADTLGADAFNRADEGGVPYDSVSQQVAIEQSLRTNRLRFDGRDPLPHQGGPDPDGVYHQGRMADCTDPVCQRGPRATLVWTERASTELADLEQEDLT